MFNKITKVSAGVALAGLTVLGLSACSPATEKDSSSSVVVEEEVGGNTNTVVAPVTASLEELAALGSDTIEVPAGNILYLDNIPDADLNNWNGTSSDESVASFTKGTAQTTTAAGTASAFTANKVGTTTITLTNTVTGQVISFTLDVVA